MRMQTLAVAAAFTVVGTVAFAQDVKVDFDKAANFSDDQDLRREDRHRLGQPAQREAGRRRDRGGARREGLGEGREPPDALVVLHGATQVKKDLNTFYSGGYGGYGWRGYGGMGMGSSSTTVNEYTVGTLVVDIFDAKSKAAPLPRHRFGRALGQAGQERQEARQGVGQDVQGLPSGLGAQEVGALP